MPKKYRSIRLIRLHFLLQLVIKSYKLNKVMNYSSPGLLHVLGNTLLIRYSGASVEFHYKPMH